MNGLNVDDNGGYPIKYNELVTMLQLSFFFLEYFYSSNETKNQNCVLTSFVSSMLSFHARRTSESFRLTAKSQKMNRWFSSTYPLLRQHVAQNITRINCLSICLLSTLSLLLRRHKKDENSDDLATLLFQYKSRNRLFNRQLYRRYTSYIKWKCVVHKTVSKSQHHAATMSSNYHKL